MGTLVTVFIVGAVLGTIAQTLIKKRKEARIRMDMYRHIGGEWVDKITEITGHTGIVIHPHKEVRERVEKRDKLWVISLPLAMGKTLHTPFDMILVIEFIMDEKPQIRTILSGLVLTTAPDLWWVPERNSPVLPDVTEQFKGKGIIFDFAPPVTA